jgi:xanthine dehydrogenase YagR molybdenum-binding subunit
LIGTSVKRLDGPDKVQGRAKYTFDVTRPGMLYGKIVRSPHAHARVLSVDLSAALKAPGVKAGLVHVEIGKRVMYQGDEVAAIAAATEEQAIDAARLVRVEYETLPHFANEEQAMRPDAPKLFDAGNVVQAQVQETGDLEAGRKAAVHTIEAEYSTHVITHVCLESHGTVCEWEGDKLTAWVSTQGVHGTRQQFATALNIPQASVRVITQFMGGGFGSKFGPDVQGLICARLAKMAAAPVKLMLDRKEEHLATGNRPSAHARIKAGCDANGVLTFFEADSWGTGGAGAGSNFPLPYLYVFPNRTRRHRNVYINAGLQRAMRAPGHPQGCFLTELMMDELADQARLDPLEFRLRNLPPDAPNARWRTYYPMGAQKIGWSRRHPTGDPTPGPIKKGMGCSGHLWGGAGQGTRVHLEIHPDGGVVVQCGTQDIGTGTKTIVAMVAAESLGLELNQVNAQIGDSNYPFSGASGGSTTAASVSPAIRVTAGKALDALFSKVAPTLSVQPTQLLATGGRIQVRDNPSRNVAWRDACKLLGTEPISMDGQWEAGLSSSGSSGVQFAEVEVDVETGITRITKIVAIQDCGLIVDKLTAESQTYGGIIASINFALYEDRILDRNTAQMVNPNMEFYLMASPSDVPEIDLTLINQPERGVIGIGEPPTVATASAIANAVANATGVRIRSLPLTPAKIIAALEREKRGGTL